MNDDRTGGRHVETIYIGGIWANRTPSVGRTILGSCISVCLRDPKLQIGGMNHFMLPQGELGIDMKARYGVHAMELLINRCMELGADRRRLEAKVFGGGHVLSSIENSKSVPSCNIDFALEFLRIESIPIVAQDIGGRQAREVLFFTDTGKVLMKRLGTSFALPVTPLTAVLNPIPMGDDNITLFLR